ncbi:transposase [Catenulispora subtropica]|uniref:Insertion element IS402-like domain-containing protein n=1 Tax=Catenulispora subtropica TaxID=450798 RepID=A0ABP5C0B4_9ACTN
MPHTPPRGEAPDIHSAVLLGVPAPRRDPASSSASGNPPLVRPRRTGHPDPVVNDRAWERISALLPERPRRRRNPGRKPLDDRAVLNGILVVLGRRIGFEKLPQELEYGSGMTCWRRLRDWQRAGIWPDIARVLREEIPETRRIDFDRVIDSGETTDGGGETRVARRPRSTTLIRQPSPVAMEFGFTALRKSR